MSNVWDDLIAEMFQDLEWTLTSEEIGEFECMDSDSQFKFLKERTYLMYKV